MKFPVVWLTVLGWVVSLAHGAAGEGYSAAVVVNTVLKTSVDGAGQPLQYPSTAPAEITGVVVEIAPGRNTGWHLHPAPCVGYMLEGEAEVVWFNGERKRFKAGECFPEVVNLPHCGYNRTDKPVKILMFALGQKALPISQKTDAPPSSANERP